MADAAFEGIGFCENNIIFDANARLAAMLGCTPNELIGMPTEQFMTIYLPRKVRAVLDSAGRLPARTCGGR